MAVAATGDFQSFARNNHFQPSLVTFLQENDLADTYILKELTTDFIDGLNLNLGQTIILKRAVASLNRSASELALQNKHEVDVMKLKMEHREKMARLYTDYNKDVMGMQKDVVKNLAEINADVIKSSKRTKTVKNETTGRKFLWGAFTGNGTSDTETVEDNGSSCVNQNFTGVTNDIQGITRRAIVNIDGGADDTMFAITED